MERVFIGVYIIGWLLVLEAIHNNKQELDKQFEQAAKRLARALGEFTKSMIQLGVTMYQAGQAVHQFAELMHDAHVSLSFPTGVGEFAPVEVYEHLCWRCMILLKDDEEDFGLCKECHQELEDL